MRGRVTGGQQRAPTGTYGPERPAGKREVPKWPARRRRNLTAATRAVPYLLGGAPLTVYFAWLGTEMGIALPVSGFGACAVGLAFGLLACRLGK
jgi:hypothetical protein